jgi:hypothetical protein
MSAEKSKPTTSEVAVEVPNIGPAIVTAVEGNIGEHHVVTYRVDATDKKTAEVALEVAREINEGTEISGVGRASKKHCESKSSSTIFDARKWEGCNWQPKGPNKIQ